MTISEILDLLDHSNYFQEEREAGNVSNETCTTINGQVRILLHANVKNALTTIMTSFQHKKFLNDKHFCGSPTEGKNPEANVRMQGSANQFRSESFYQVCIIKMRGNGSSFDQSVSNQPCKVV